MAESRFVIGEKRAKPFYIIGTILLILILSISLPTAKIFPQKKQVLRKPVYAQLANCYNGRIDGRTDDGRTERQNDLCRSLRAFKF